MWLKCENIENIENIGYFQSKLNKEDAMDHKRWRKQIRDD